MDRQSGLDQTNPDLFGSNFPIKTEKKRQFPRFVALVTLSIIIFGLLIAATLGDAAQFSNRVLTLGSSAPSASTTYTFTFTVPSATVIKSFAADICTTASGTCTTPAGFSNASSTISQPTNLGDASGWTVSTATAGSLRLSKSGNVAAPSGSQTVVFSSVTNPSATNSTFFARLTTYSDATWTTAIDTGNVASSTAGQITVTASVDETLTFTLTSATVALGTLSTGTTASGTSAMSIATNAKNGFAVSYYGSTLTSGANTIDPVDPVGTSTAGVEQFGIYINGGCCKTNDYLNDFNPPWIREIKFNSGDSIVAYEYGIDAQNYTINFLANISSATPAGQYSTALTFIAAATF